MSAIIHQHPAAAIGRSRPLMERQMSPTMHTYKGYKITVRGDEDRPDVAVFDPRYPKAPAFYRAASLDKAMRWVDAYLKGEAWANDLAVGQARNDAMPSMESGER